MARPIREANWGRVADGIENILREAAPRKGQAVLFGSRARGDARSDSDRDVLILLDKDRITPADMDEMINPVMCTLRR